MKISKRKDRNLYFAYVRQPNGKYTKVYGKTKKEVKEKAESLSLDYKEGKFAETNDLTFESWNNEWLENYLINVSESTQVTYTKLVKTYVNPYLGSKRIQKITHNDIQVLINKLSKRLAPKTIRNIYLVIHRSLKDAKLNGYIAFNPGDDIILPKAQKREMEVLSKDEMKEFLNIAYEQEPEYADCFEFLILTGLRMGEFIGLTIDSYNPETRKLNIFKQFSLSVNKFTPPKYDIRRTIFLGDREHEIIMKHIKEVKKLRKIFPEKNKDNFIFLNPDFERIRDNTLRHVLKRIAKKIGKPDLRVHDLRHTNATLALASGIDIKTISQNLGHSTTQFTMNKYAHSTEDMQKRGVDLMNDFLY